MLIYEAPGSERRMEVRLEGATVWLTQRQMAEVFGTSADNVGLHLKNIFDDGELQAEATTEDFSVVRSEGRRNVRRCIRHYNLDAIISLGYRVNSKQGVHFRQWATRALREHLERGYTINEQRLDERSLDEALETLDLLAQTWRNRAPKDDTSEAVLGLIVEYADTWRLLLEYDERRLDRPSSVQPAREALNAERTIRAIEALRRDLAARGEASALFGNRRGEALEAILGNIEQTMFGKPLYRSREEKAAHLLYFVVKDHPFTDGNKRLGALLFLLYLAQEGVTHQLGPGALTALILLIAESAPANKDLMVRLVMNLLATSSR